MNSNFFLKATLFFIGSLLCSNRLICQGDKKLINQNKEFVIRHNCKNCSNGKIFINRNRPCHNCEYWTKEQRRFNYCNVCRNTGVIYGKNSLVPCNICKQTGITSSKINISFKNLFERFFDLDDSRTQNQDAMIYSLSSEDGSLRFTNVIDFNTVQFLCFSKGSRYVLQFKSNGDIVITEFENHLERAASTGSWEVNDNSFKMQFPFKLKSYGDDRTLKIVKKVY